VAWQLDATDPRGTRLLRGGHAGEPGPVVAIAAGGRLRIGAVSSTYR
jgi:hypothetical protein